MITSSRSRSARVAEWRMRSISSLMEEVLLDIGVGARDIGFRLVIVVIGDEILHRVVGKEALELAVELRRQRLVRSQDQGRPLRRLDHLGHGEGLARAGDAEQHLGALVAVRALDQFGDGGGLIALGLHVAADREWPPAFGFLRPWRPVRRPGALPAGELRAALAQQPLQRLHRGVGGDGRRRRRRLVVGRCIVAADQGLGRVRRVEAQRLAQLVVDVERLAGDVAALRRLLETLRRRTCAPCGRRRNRRAGRKNCRAAA